MTIKMVFFETYLEMRTLGAFLTGSIQSYGKLIRLLVEAMCQRVKLSKRANPVLAYQLVA